ncbi:hypothetical protein [Peptoniphilus vaginalis]|uniref:hypothetical protein n=1 Tax=Peptoniphilus vaginalis TaxID=1756987 RepID=UPI0023F9A882|nr:hypothetical protein [Peptoniphilus vaginalis]
MKGTNYIIAVIVIACLIFWRKSIVKKRKKTQKSIDTSSKAKNNFKKEELHKMSEAKSSKETSSDKVPEVKEKGVYDGSRKKDRGKNRDQKKNTNSVIDEIKEKTEEVKEKVKEEVKEEKLEIENKIASTDNYLDLIASIKNNPWTAGDLNTKVKLEDTRKKITLSEEEITDLPLDQIKASLSPESLADFLNITSTKPTILNRKEDTSYEFTTQDKEEVDLIKKRYGFLDREIDKITSILIFDKEGQKLKEVKDVLTEGKNRIYMETKF